jgi:hypothetical protein
VTCAGHTHAQIMLDCKLQASLRLFGVDRPSHEGRFTVVREVSDCSLAEIRLIRLILRHEASFIIHPFFSDIQG